MYLREFKNKIQEGISFKNKEEQLAARRKATKLRDEKFRKAREFASKYLPPKKVTKEEAEQIKEEQINYRKFATDGVMHPNMAKYMKRGNDVDFYSSKTGDKLYGKVIKNDGRNVHIKHLSSGYDDPNEKGIHKFRVSATAPHQMKKEEVEQIDEAKRAINITTKDLDIVKSGDHETVKNHMVKLITRAADARTNARPLRADKAKEFLDKIHGSTNVGQLQKMAYNMYLGGDDEGKAKYGNLHVYKPTTKMGRSYQRRYGIGEEVEQIDEITITNVTPPRGLPGKSSAQMGKEYRDSAKKWNAENPPGKFDKEAHMKKVLANIASLKKEEAEQVNEMDKSQPSSSRGAEGLATGSKATPITAKKTTSAALVTLDQAYAKGRFGNAPKGSKTLKTMSDIRLANKLTKEEVEQIDEGGPTRKHFQQVADLIKANPNPELRKALAKHHSDIFAKQNPRFDKARFHKAAGVEMSESALEPGANAVNAERNLLMRVGNKHFSPVERSKIITALRAKNPNRMQQSTLTKYYQKKDSLTHGSLSNAQYVRGLRK